MPGRASGLAPLVRGCRFRRGSLRLRADGQMIRPVRAGRSQGPALPGLPQLLPQPWSRPRQGAPDQQGAGLADAKHDGQAVNEDHGRKALVHLDTIPNATLQGRNVEDEVRVRSCGDNRACDMPVDRPPWTWPRFRTGKRSPVSQFSPEAGDHDEPACPIPAVQRPAKRTVAVYQSKGNAQQRRQCDEAEERV